MSLFQCVYEINWKIYGTYGHVTLVSFLQPLFRDAREFILFLAQIYSNWTLCRVCNVHAKVFFYYIWMYWNITCQFIIELWFCFGVETPTNNSISVRQKILNTVTGSKSLRILFLLEKNAHHKKKKLFLLWNAPAKRFIWYWHWQLNVRIQ